MLYIKYIATGIRYFKSCKNNINKTAIIINKSNPSIILILVIVDIVQPTNVINANNNIKQSSKYLVLDNLFNLVDRLLTNSLISNIS